MQLIRISLANTAIDVTIISRGMKQSVGLEHFL